MAKYNVLVFPGGTEVGLEICKALGDCKDISLYSAGLDVSNHAPYLFARHFTVPSIHETGWIESINQIIQNCAIDAVFPAYDDIILALAENSMHINATVISSPTEACRITRSKSITYRVLKDILPGPHIYDSPEDILSYPVFVKPDRGQGSERAQIICDAETLQVVLRTQPDLILMEYLPGPEYTIDCFSDRERGLLFCRGRQRIRTKSGISMACCDVNDAGFETFAQAIGQRLSLRGAWFFQCKRNTKGELRLLEVAPRIAGAMCMHRVLGVNFPLLSIYEHLRVPYRIMTNRIRVELDRSLVNRYKFDLNYDFVYVDLDDTLILNGAVNTDLVKFLYQCVNAGRKIVLVTRHEDHLPTMLAKYRLTELFDETFVVSRDDRKSSVVTAKSAIFIDDSFRERTDIAETCGIPTFDASMIEMLIDDRK